MKRVLIYLEAPTLIAAPATLVLCAFFGVSQSAILTVAVVLVSLAVFLANYESSKPAFKQTMPALLYGTLLNTWHIIGFIYPLTW